MIFFKVSSVISFQKHKLCLIGMMVMMTTMMMSLMTTITSTRTTRRRRMIIFPISIGNLALKFEKNIYSMQFSVRGLYSI